MSDAIARINAAIEQWECGLDAARWSPDKADASETRVHVDLDARPWFGTESIRMAAEVQRQIETLVHARRLALPIVEMSVLIGAFTEAIRQVQEAAKQLTAALGLKPCHLGAGPCACHPAPNPAACDYRRRTKHRNRKQR